MPGRDATMSEAAVTPCEGCPNGGARAVATRGPVPARLLFLSGAPRLHEEQHHYAFASPALSWLEQRLAEVGLDPASVHFATLIGCRPPYQRPMRADEIAACAPRLERTIAAVAPEVIVLCGPDAVEALLPGVALGAMHGQIVTRDGRRYMPLRHPYAALHNERYVAEVIADLAQLATQLAAGLPDLPQTAPTLGTLDGPTSAIQTEKAEPLKATQEAVGAGSRKAGLPAASSQAEAEQRAVEISAAPHALSQLAEAEQVKLAGQELVETAEVKQDGAGIDDTIPAEAVGTTEPETIATEQDGPAQLSLF